MSLSMQFIRILRASREPMNALTFSKMTGSSMDTTLTSLKYCVSYRYMVVRNGLYELTLEGAKRSKFTPKTDARRLALKSVRDKKKRADLKANALQTWGGAHA